MPPVLINGRVVDAPERTTSDDLRRLAAIDPTRKLLQRTPDGFDVLPSNAPLEPKEGDAFYDAPARVKGNADRTVRVLQEVPLLAQEYQDGVWYDEHAASWVMIPAFPLPHRWSRKSAKLLLMLPDLYPIVPPIGFYLDEHLPLANGKADPFFVGYGAHGARDLRQDHWYWYCATAQRTGRAAWRSSVDYQRPDNLLSFLAMAHDALATEA